MARPVRRAHGGAVVALQRHAGRTSFIRRFGMPKYADLITLGAPGGGRMIAGPSSRLARDRGHPPRARPLDAALHHRPLPGRLRALLGRLAPRLARRSRTSSCSARSSSGSCAQPLRRHRHLRRRAVRRAPRPVARRAPRHRGGQAPRRLHERRVGQARPTRRPGSPTCSTAARPSSSPPTPSTPRASATATTSTPRGRSSAPARGSSCRSSTSTTWFGARTTSCARRSARTTRTTPSCGRSRR